MRDTEAETHGSRARALCGGAFCPVHISVYFPFTVIQGGKVFTCPFLKRGDWGAEVQRTVCTPQSPWSRFQSRFCPSVFQKVTSSFKKNSNAIIALNKDFGVSYKVSHTQEKTTNQQHQALWLPFVCQLQWALSFACVISFNPQNNLAPILQMEKTQIIYIACMGSHRKHQGGDMSPDHLTSRPALPVSYIMEREQPYVLWGLDEITSVKCLI